MKRIYHTWEKWECFPAGFYESNPPGSMTAKEANEAYRDFLVDSDRFERALWRVISEWKKSSEHYLSNDKMNRIAWLGQAAMCIETRIPAAFRGGFNLLSSGDQEKANALALKYLNKWLAARSESTVSMEEAGVSAKANIY